MSEANTPKIKICGITTMKEADWLNEADVDYAGFVFFEKSKRNISLSDAVMIKKSLYPHIQTVAVTVSPTVELLRQIEIAGFDIIQVHKELRPEVLEECKIPIWRAFNITKLDGSPIEAAAPESPEEKERRELLEDQRIEAYVLDGVNFGSGVTFDWKESNVAAIRQLFGTKKLVLAGGLNPGNVAEGIRIFSPDIVDVSSGVERDFGSGKDREKIIQFTDQVRRQNHEE
jgi:phosphoribosylanthranilate isomerase